MYYKYADASFPLLGAILFLDITICGYIKFIV